MRGLRPLFLLGTLLLAGATGAFADEVTDDLDRPSMWRMKSLRVGAAKLRSSLANDPDTVWIGHIADPSWVPVDRNGNSVPSSARDANGAPTAAGTVPIGGYGPHHLGRGANLPSGDASMGVPGGPGTHWNGIWDFDHYQAGDDSLQGWWPIARPAQILGAGESNDRIRAWHGLAYGNQGNYAMNMGSVKRTFGVTGYWHRDPGNGATPAYVDVTPTVAGPNVDWAPLGGTQSAWCGLRAADDFAAVDGTGRGGTGNPINSRVLDFNGNNSYNPTGALNALGGTDKNFPGYGSQWDQILYRDIDLSGVSVGDNVTISFGYVHALSPVRGGTDVQRIGYFWKDPIRPAKTGSNDGNFVSATEAEPTLQGPVDSFTVTLGVPVEISPDVLPGVANDFLASDGSAKNIHDPLRRWFSEVLSNGGMGNAPMIELLSRSRFSTAAGGMSNPPFTAPPEPATFSATIARNPAGTAQERSLDALINASGGRVRLAFRVLTNRGNDDEDAFASSFSSFTRGAAIVDDVVLRKNGAGPNLITNGDFEGEGSIDNTVNGIASTVTNGSATVTSSGLFGPVNVGSTVTGQNIPAGTTVLAKASNSSITISNSAIALSGSAQVTLYFDMVSALEAWKSTGKPPGVYVHVHCVNSNCAYTPGLWNDPCSPPNLLDARAPNRSCSMVGNVLSGGDHDAAERPGGVWGGNEQNRQQLVVSPSIVLATDPDPTKYNPMGLNRDIVDGSTEWALWFDVHTAGFRGTANSVFRSVGMQCYPATQPNGAPGWGETRFTTAITFNTSNTCVPNFISLKQAGFVHTSNPSGIPDSIRIHFQYVNRCGTFDSFNCNLVAGSLVGGYIDNLSLAIIQGGILTAGLSNFPWMWFIDAFPTYVDPATGLPRTSFASSSFDTAAAKVKSAINRHAATGNTLRPSVPGDSAQVTSGVISGGGRVDLVFRILPGPGNYVTMGNRLTQIRQVPTALVPAVGNATSMNFWENYMADTGPFGTGGNGVMGAAHDPDGGGPIVAGTRWDWNAWNSARMDTLERNLWPALSNSANLASNSGGTDWQTTYHELDGRFSELGVAKNRCFLANPAGGQPVSCKSKTPVSTADCNVVCQLLPGGAPFGVFPPAWTAAAGYPGGGENGLPAGQTFEFTKIIPDGQLTPGAHVQYFYRREPGLLQPFDIWPDTTQIFDGSTADGARWFHMSILPDAWKKAVYGGEGFLCMLVVDNFDRNGDEFFWVSAADSIGLTSTPKRGAHNGWHAAGGQNDPGTFSQATLRRDNGGQPGSVWDLWNTRAGESGTGSAAWLSNRITAQPVAGSWLEGKTNTTGPTGDMLRFFYRSLVYLTGTAAAASFGAVADRGDDDFAQLNDFALLPGAGPRAVLVWGSGFAEGLTGAAGGPAPAGGTAFLSSFFGASLTNLDYRSYSGNVAPVAHYNENPGSAHDLAGGQSGLTYGLVNGCGTQNDVLAAVPAAAPGATAQTFAENYGTLGPYPATVYVPSGGSGSPHPHYTMLDGTRISRVGSYASVLPLARQNFRHYVQKSLTITTGSVCFWTPPSIGVGDGPGSFVNFLELRSSNPMRSGEARLAFGLTTTERVEVRMFDVTGRLVKTVAKRVFQGGKEHVVVWDGTDEAGNRMKSGVYFYQLKTPTWTSQKKLTLLSN